MKFTASSTGRVWIETNTWAYPPEGDIRNRFPQVVRRVVRIAPERFAAFREQLRPYRPVGELMLDRPPACEMIENHSEGVIVRWQGSGENGQLIFDFSCDPERRRAIRDALQTAPALLGIPNLRLRE